MKTEKCKQTGSVLMQWSQQKLYQYLTEVFKKKCNVFVYEYFKITEEKIRFTMWFHDEWKSLNGKSVRNNVLVKLISISIQNYKIQPHFQAYAFKTFSIY